MTAKELAYKDIGERTGSAYSCWWGYKLEKTLEVKYYSGYLGPCRGYKSELN